MCTSLCFFSLRLHLFSIYDLSRNRVTSGRFGYAHRFSSLVCQHMALSILARSIPHLYSKQNAFPELFQECIFLRLSLSPRFSLCEASFYVHELRNHKTESPRTNLQIQDKLLAQLTRDRRTSKPQNIFDILLVGWCVKIFKVEEKVFAERSSAIERKKTVCKAR